jgi:pimeloyl-ACP methyl ester carboxylesterase
MSRAGYGTSSRHVGRQVVDVVSDTAALLAHLGASQSLIGGTSGGGPHALACAARLPGVLAVASVAGVAPFGLDDLDFLAGMGEGNIVEFGKSLEGEAVLRPFLEAEAEGLAGATPGQLIDAMSTLLPEVDRACITDEFGDGMIASMTEGLHRGVDGWVDDDLAFTRDWGFSLDEIAVPVFVWQGDADLMVPFAHGQWLAGRVPGATASLLAGEGHISIGVGKFGEILDSLLAVVSSDN